MTGIWRFIWQNEVIPAVMFAIGPVPGDETDVDREIRIEKMKRELDELSEGSMISGAFEQISPELEEIFLTRVCEFEKAQWDTNFIDLFSAGLQ